VLLLGLLGVLGALERHRETRPRPVARDWPFADGHLLRRTPESRFVFKIATVYFLPFYNDQQGGADPSLEAATSRLYDSRRAVLERLRGLGANTIRVPLGSGPWQARDDVYDVGGSTGLVERFAEVVKTADELGMLVMPSWWDATSSSIDFAASYRTSFPMMKAIAERVASFDNVVYEPWNEPRASEWEPWAKAMTATIEFFREELGYRGLLVLDTIDYSWSFSPSWARRLQGVDRAILGYPNLAFANHRYANESTCFCDGVLAAWQEEVGAHVDNFPIVGTEYGYWNRDWLPSPTFSTQLVDHLVEMTRRGFGGYGAFTWFWLDPNTMTKNDLTTLTPFGEIAVRYWQRVADDGSVTASP
jgi:hypothetical protein